jgi:uncharacterized phage protein (TIGR01671 family)
MRPIKFRAWDTEKNLMAYDVQDEYDTIAGIRYWKDGVKTNEEPEEVSFSSYLSGKYNLDGDLENKWIVMQFTGLLDKNGKEIYEGDIVQEDVRHITAEIVWREQSCSFVRHEIKPHGTKCNWELYPVDSNIYEVIGNIHENKDLLRGGL